MHNKLLGVLMADNINEAGKNKKVQEFKLNSADSTLRASPELTYMQALKDAYYSSQYAIASKPLVFLDRATAGIRDVFLKQVRSNLSAEVDLGLTGALRDAMNPIFWAASGDWSRPGDQQISPALEQKSDEFWAKRGRPEKFGEYDFQMAAGWTIPKGTKMNGVPVKEDQMVTNMLAVFMRDKAGNIEVLNPSTQVTSLLDLRKVPSALWGTSKNPADTRWKETAGTYIETQLAPMIASGGFSAVEKITATGASKIPQLAGVANRVQDVGKVLNHGSLKMVGTLNGINGGAMISDGFIFQAHMKASALKEIVQLVSNPTALNAKSLRESLNDALHSYTFDKGSHAQQIYIPSLKEKDNPFAALEGLITSSSAEGYRKKNNPWEKWQGPVSIRAEDISDALLKSKDFERSFLSVAGKVLSGEKLSDNELFVLRANLALKTGDNKIFGKHSDETSFNFSQQEKSETLTQLKGELNRALVAKAAENPKLAAQLGISQADLKANAIDSATGIAEPYKFTDKQLSTFVKDESKKVDAEIVARDKPKNPIIQNRIDSPFVMG